MTEAPTLGDLKRYYELRAKLFSDVGITDIKSGEFAGSKAVLVKFTRNSFYKETGTGKGGEEESKWKGTTIGMIKDGFFYRISAGSHLETYDEANEKYLEKILSSFQFTH